ncbi:uncharacterized protein LOC112529425 isoform X2 [Cynara cardunculus var. scolymus]|uniref:uncharacterized protein LOC112529425 isoform X2 n=1 Tax=Cynara cardunculus var. scolymus TaxID=59895 RepID=UPI000D6298FA|nr:uncharacterized protein LOC112529425 isoform X2 [Cynara cardunculus var. scolymus]
MEMEGRVYSDLYRNTSEDMFIRTMMESSVGIPAPTMEMLGFKNLSSNFRADSEELFKSWLTTGENQGHNSTGLVHNRPRQLSRMLTDQANGDLHPTKRSSENLTPQSTLAVGESSCGMNEHSVRNLAEKGLQDSNLFLAKAWFNSSQPMTRSRSSELRRKYVAMQNSQTAIGIEAMHNASALRINQLKQDFVNEFKEDSSSSTFSAPKVGPIDKVSSVVSMLKGTLERKKLGNHVDKEAIEDSSFGYHGGQEVFAYSHMNQVREIHMHEAQGGTFQDLTTAGIKDPEYADLACFMAPTNLIQMNIASQEPSQSESSAAAPVISTGFDVSDGPSNSGQSPSVCESPRKQVGNAKSTENGCVAKDIRERVYGNLKEDQKNKGNLSRHGSVTSAASGAERGDPTKKRRVERSRKMAEAKERTQTPTTSSDMQSILKRCENLEKEVRSLKLNLAFMNRKDSEQTKQIEELQKQNEDMGDEKERLLEEIERILSQQDNM